jgi:hypothetical protein
MSGRQSRFKGAGKRTLGGSPRPAASGGEYDSLAAAELCREKSSKLLTEAEFLYDSLVPLGIVFLEVVEQATPLADQHEKTAARSVILLVRLEVLRQLTNAFT